MKLKEAVSKLLTVGTRTDREAVCGRRAGRKQRSPKAIKTHKVESDGTRGKSQHLPEETFLLRGKKESADVIVAMTFHKNGKERRTEEPKRGAKEGTGG